MSVTGQRWRRLLGVCLLVVYIAVAAIGIVIRQIVTPYESPGRVSPDGQWRAWLQRPNGSMESKYYTVKVRRNSMFATPICDVAVLTNLFAERYVRVAWPAPSAVRIDYGLSVRDTGGVGAPSLSKVPESCRGLVVTARRDRSLDTEATRTNDTNSDYAIRPDEPPDFAIENSGSQSPSSPHS